MHLFFVGDALFNLPAFLTADLWSKAGATAFLYQFNHRGKPKTALHFLKGVPIMGNHSQRKYPIQLTVAEQLTNRRVRSSVASKKSVLKTQRYF